MVIPGQQCATPTGLQKSSTNHKQILTEQINTAGIPVYQLDSSSIQAFLTRSTMTALGGSEGSAQKSKTYKVSTEFKVSEGDIQII